MWSLAQLNKLLLSGSYQIQVISNSESEKPWQILIVRIFQLDYDFQNVTNKILTDHSLDVSSTLKRRKTKKRTSFPEFTPRPFITVNFLYQHKLLQLFFHFALVPGESISLTFADCKSYRIKVSLCLSSALKIFI